MNSAHFESYRQADIYSLALVLWEITRRCEFDGEWHLLICVLVDSSRWRKASREKRSGLIDS